MNFEADHSHVKHVGGEELMSTNMPQEELKLRCRYLCNLSQENNPDRKNIM